MSQHRSLLLLCLSCCVLGSVPAFGAGSAFAAAPVVESEGESVTNVSSSAATLEAVVNPEGAAATYHFEYDTSAYTGSVVHGSSSPGGSLGAVSTGVAVSAHVQGLVPGTVYHYRVVARNAASETVYGEDHTFTTQSTGGEFALPDGREWEVVSPPNKQGSGVEPLSQFGGIVQASEEGGAITYIANAPTEADPQGNRSEEFSQILARRGAQGWQSEDITTPNNAVSEIGVGYKAEYEAFSGDLSLGLVNPKGETPLPPLREGAEKTIYLRNNDEKAFVPLVTASNVLPGAHVEGNGSPGQYLHFAGASSNLQHVILSSPEALTAEAGVGPNLYMWQNGELQLVSVLPDGEALSKGTEVTAALGDGGDVRNAVSENGSQVIWEADQEGNYQQSRPAYRDLLARELTAKITVQLNVAQGTIQPFEGEEHGPSSPEIKFQGASSNGSRIFFTDDQRLTSTSQAAEGGPDLYVFEVSDDKLTDLTVDARKSIEKVTQKEQADVFGDVLGYAESGESVYFMAKGVVASGATPHTEGPVQCREKPPGESEVRCNLYVAHFNGQTWETRFIALLSGEDLPDWDATQPYNLTHLTARVSSNGRYLAFMSDRRLTGYDNRDVNNGVPDEEVYLYDETTGKIVCASCNPTGERPTGTFGGGALVNSQQNWGSEVGEDQWLAGDVPGWDSIDQGRAGYQPRYLSDSGRLFFDSPDALAPADVDGEENVYEYQPEGEDCNAETQSAAEVFKHEAGGAGCVGLISSGASSHESAFLDASSNGNDVFFITSAQLVSSDVDSAYDVYDAHVCSVQVPCAAAAVAVPPCTNTDSCRAAPTPQPALFGAPSSATFAGSGNTPPSTVVVAAKAKPLTKTQLLARALKSCKKYRKAGKRRICEAKARRAYRASAGSGRVAKKGRRG